jgi:IS1 family transposase
MSLKDRIKECVNRIYNYRCEIYNMNHIRENWKQMTKDVKNFNHTMEIMEYDINVISYLYHTC